MFLLSFVPLLLLGAFIAWAVFMNPGDEEVSSLLLVILCLGSSLVLSVLFVVSIARKHQPKERKPALLTAAAVLPLLLFVAIGFAQQTLPNSVSELLVTWGGAFMLGLYPALATAAVVALAVQGWRRTRDRNYVGLALSCIPMTVFPYAFALFLLILMVRGVLEHGPPH